MVEFAAIAAGLAFQRDSEFAIGKMGKVVMR
jgi:hypothetical protein